MTLLTKVVASSPAGYATPLLAILLPKGGLPESLGPLDHQTGGILQRVIAAGDFTGKRDEAVLCHPPGPAGRALLVGLGPAADRQASDIRRGAAVAAKRARQVGAPAMAVAVADTALLPARRVAQALIMQAYIESWRLGVKAIAIYRDGSKRTQPLNTSKNKDAAAAAVAEVVTRIVTQPIRRKLPEERQAIIEFL